MSDHAKQHLVSHKTSKNQSFLSITKREGSPGSTLNRLCKAFALGLTALVLLTTFGLSQNLYVTCTGSGTVERIDPFGNRSVLASPNSTRPSSPPAPATIPWNTDPWGLACDDNGSLYVSAIQGQTIYKFDSSGSQFIFASGLSLTRPSSLAFDRSGSLYVAKQWEGTVEKFDSGGNQSVFASGLTIPNWLALDDRGNLFVTTMLTVSNGVTGGIIEKFDSNGYGLLFASTGLSGGYWGLACDSGGNLYAATYADGKILKFDSSGNQSVFASGLNYPAGLAFDDRDNLYATIAADGAIAKFDPSGAATIVASGLDFPLGIAVQTIPEPSILAILGMGAGLFAGIPRLRSRCGSTTAPPT
jgi:hypothetical protein